MIEYNYLEDKTLEELNVLGSEDWEIISIEIIKGQPTPQGFDVFLKQGRQGYSTIKVDSQTTFYIDKSYSLGSSILIIFATIFMFAMISKIIYGWLFKND